MAPAPPEAEDMDNAIVMLLSYIYCFSSKYCNKCDLDVLCYNVVYRRHVLLGVRCVCNVCVLTVVKLHVEDFCGCASVTTVYGCHHF